MRWLLVSSQHHPSHGGIGTYVTRFIAAAVDAGWKTDLVTRPGGLHPAGATVHEVVTPDMDESFAQRLPGLRRIERVRPYRYALWSRALAEKLLSINNEFDAIEFVDCQAEGYASLCSPAIRRRFAGAPLIVHAHTPMFVEERINHADPNRFGRSIYHEWEKQALRAADGVIATSKLLADHLLAVRQLAVIPYPIASEPFDQPTTILNNESILLIGSIQPRKGVETWARSLNRVLRERPSASAMLIGSDTPTAPNGQSMAEHVLQIVDPAVRDRFQWIGPTAHPEVIRMISTAAMVVVPSLFESFSFVAAEAMTRGIPVIVSDQVGIAEHVKGMKVVPAGDAQALAAAQLEVLGDRSIAQRQALECRRRLLESCAPASHLQRRISFIEAIKAAPVGGVARPFLDLAEPDALESIDEFIASVERSERSLATASSSKS